MYLWNCWYVAACSAEVGRTPFARTLLDLPVMLYRTEAGTPIAFEDRCCHRNLPLSLGSVEGDAIRCGYHGLKFDASGACIEIPGQPAIPPGAKVRRYPLIERWNFVWIWLGDPACVDESLMPDWSYVDRPNTATVVGNGGKPLHMKCNWELNNDNLMDLSHVFFVHRSTLGGSGFDRFPVKTERGERSVRMSRWNIDVAPTPIFAQYLNYKGNVDRWQITVAEAPTHCAVDAGFAPTGQADPDKESDRDRFIRFRPLITATPETESTSFMFYCHSRNFAVEDQALSARVMEDFRRVFYEDIAVMEAQQRNNDRGGGNIDINADIPVLALRRLLRQMAAAEGNARPAA